MYIQMQISVFAILILIKEGYEFALWDENIIDEEGTVFARFNWVTYLLSHLLSIIRNVLDLAVLFVVQKDFIPYL